MSENLDFDLSSATGTLQIPTFQVPLAFFLKVTNSIVVSKRGGIFVDTELRLELLTCTSPLWQHGIGPPNALIPYVRSSMLMKAPLSGRGMFHVSCGKEGLHNEMYWCRAKPSGTACFPFGPHAAGESLGEDRKEMYPIPVSRKLWEWANATEQVEISGLILISRPNVACQILVRRGTS